MRFAISGVFIKEQGNGKLNIQNKLMCIEGCSLEEAIGKFTESGFKQFPEHSLFMIPTFLDLEHCKVE